MTLWKNRLSGNMSNAMKNLNNSLHVDIRLFPYDVRLNEAWAEELHETGILSGKELEDIKKAIPLLSEEYFSGAYTEIPEDEDVHSLVERRLTDISGEAGKKIHTGKSRNDQVVTDLKLYLKDATEEIIGKIAALMSESLKIAENNLETVMPGYTHLQQAQPITLAHYLLSLTHSLLEDLRRIKTYRENNLGICPLGSGALAGTTLNINRERLAENLGFATASGNSIQATSDRAFVIEFAALLSIIAMHLSRYAEDLIIWSSREFSFIELSDSVSTGSSMMPQKKNPDSLELIRAATGTAYGNLVGLLTITKGVPLSYAKDLQDDKKFIFESIDLIGSSLELFREVFAKIKFNKDRMKSSIDHSTLMTDLADILIKKGMPFRKAYEEIATLVKTASENKKHLADLTEDELKKITKNITPTDIKSLSFENSIAIRSAIGGTAPSSAKKQIEEIKKVILD